MHELMSEDPRSVGPYRLLALLGTGGMGRVYLGRDAGGRHAAVKLVRPELADDPEFRTRFRREAEASATLRSPWTARLLGADTQATHPWIASTYVPGPSLNDAVRTCGPLSPHAVRVLGAALAAALEEIHAAGLVHRDVKPSNVLLSPYGPRLIDFGIARSLDATSMTTTGAMIGSIGFMSPEQASGERLGAASDVFSLGAALTFAATGVGPFGEGNDIGHLLRLREAEPSLGSLHHDLRAVIGACLAKDPGARPDAADVSRAFAADDIVLSDLSPGWLPAAVLDAIARQAVDTLDRADPPDDRTAPAPTGDDTATARLTARDADPAPTSVYGDTAGVRTAVPRRQRRRPKRTRRLLGWATAVLSACAAAAGVLALSGWWTPGSGQPHGSAKPSPSASPLPLPASFAGRWKGLSAETWYDGTGQVTVEVTFSEGPVGTLVGRVRYGRVNLNARGSYEVLCDTSFVLAGSTGPGDVRLVPGGQPGDVGTCVSPGVSVAMRSDGTLTWTGTATGGARYLIPLQRVP